MQNYYQHSWLLYIHQSWYLWPTQLTRCVKLFQACVSIFTMTSNMNAVGEVYVVILHGVCNFTQKIAFHSQFSSFPQTVCNFTETHNFFFKFTYLWVQNFQTSKGVGQISSMSCYMDTISGQKFRQFRTRLWHILSCTAKISFLIRQNNVCQFR